MLGVRYVRFQRGAHIGHGVVDGEGVVDVSRRMPSAAEAIAALHAGRLDPEAGERFALDDIAILPPTPNGRYFCIGYNYSAHRAELKASDIAPPTLFVRNPASVVGHGARVLQGAATQCYDYEGELAAIIGADCHAATAARALDFVAGYACFMDGSARDLQRASVGAGKNFDRSGAVGPWVQSASDIPDPQQLALETRVNGAVVQSASTAQMILSVAEIIAYISAFIVLRPGDVIATGTPAGVGMSFDPPRWLQPEDRVDVTIAGVGTLSNVVQGPDSI